VTSMARQVDVVLANAHVLTMDERYTVYRSGRIAIGGGVIRAVGQLGPEYDGVETIDCRGRVVMRTRTHR
jgi:cytosine/adenosine deaminase-related metal-dependent hydrolase